MATTESVLHIEVKGRESWRGSEEDSARASDWLPRSNCRDGGLDPVLIGGGRSGVVRIATIEFGAETLERDEISKGSDRKFSSNGPVNSNLVSSSRDRENDSAAFKQKLTCRPGLLERISVGTMLFDINCCCFGEASSVISTSSRSKVSELPICDLGEGRDSRDDFLSA